MGKSIPSLEYDQHRLIFISLITREGRPLDFLPLPALELREEHLSVREGRIDLGQIDPLCSL